MYRLCQALFASGIFVVAVWLDRASLLWVVFVSLMAKFLETIEAFCVIAEEYLVVTGMIMGDMV